MDSYSKPTLSWLGGSGPQALEEDSDHLGAKDPKHRFQLIEYMYNGVNMKVKLTSLFPHKDSIEKCLNYSLPLTKTENEIIQRLTSDSGLRSRDTLLPELPLQHPIDGHCLQVTKERIEHGIDLDDVGQSSIDQRSSHHQTAVRTIIISVAIRDEMQLDDWMRIDNCLAVRARAE
jgi:hypothetical protein